VLLRGSGQHAGQTYDDRFAIDAETDSGVSHARLLLDFAEACVARSVELSGRREALRKTLGEAALVDAAATIAIFQAVVKVADATGIPLEDAKAEISAEFRAELGLNAFVAE
jgi:hypothetical protein